MFYAIFYMNTRSNYYKNIFQFLTLIKINVIKFISIFHSCRQHKHNQESFINASKVFYQKNMVYTCILLFF